MVTDKVKRFRFERNKNGDLIVFLEREKRKEGYKNNLSNFSQQGWQWMNVFTDGHAWKMKWRRSLLSTLSWSCNSGTVIGHIAVV